MARQPRHKRAASDKKPASLGSVLDEIGAVFIGRRITIKPRPDWPPLRRLPTERHCKNPEEIPDWQRECCDTRSARTCSALPLHVRPQAVSRAVVALQAGNSAFVSRRVTRDCLLKTSGFPNMYREVTGGMLQYRVGKHPPFRIVLWPDACSLSARTMPCSHPDRGHIETTALELPTGGVNRTNMEKAGCNIDSLYHADQSDIVFGVTGFGAFCSA